MAKIRFKNSRLKEAIEKLKTGNTPLKAIFEEKNKGQTLPTAGVFKDAPQKTGYEGYHRDM